MAITEATTVMRPVETGERIQVMDVLRGLALLGIALMNIEFFNSPTWEFQRGLPPELTGLDRIAGWWVMVLVTGKFWMLFSILFGMGFALMLERAQARGAPFMKTYLRRTFALMVFGLLHAIVLWNGDILYGYSITAIMLLLTLFGRWWHWLIVAAVAGVVWLVTQNTAWSMMAAPLVLAALLAPYLRKTEKPWRLWRAAVALYGLFAVLQLVGGIAMTLKPDAKQAQTAEQQAALQKRIAKVEATERAEAKAFQSPVFADGLARRAESFIGHHAPNNAIFSVIALPMFLLGAWLARSRRIVEAERFKAFWRRWLWLLPVAVTITAASMWIGEWMPRGNEAAMGKPMIGHALRMAMAPVMTFGYIAMVVLLMQRAAGRKWIGWIAPAGRMALTNYLMQSLICAFVFYGWGLAQWGMPRHQQVLFVGAMWLAQVALSHVWLRHFRYGPMEWLWRWLTYGRMPALRAPAASTA